MTSYMHHVWRSYPISDVERGGLLPEPGSVASEQFHESLYASLELQGEIWECPECTRLLLRRPGDKIFRIYLLEPRGDA